MRRGARVHPPHPGDVLVRERNHEIRAIELFNGRLPASVHWNLEPQTENRVPRPPAHPRHPAAFIGVGSYNVWSLASPRNVLFQEAPRHHRPRGVSRAQRDDLHGSEPIGRPLSNAGDFTKTTIERLKFGGLPFFISIIS